MLLLVGASDTEKRFSFDKLCLSLFSNLPTFFSAKKVAKKLESGMRSFSPILRLDRFGDFYELPHGTQVLVQYNHSLMQAFI